MIEKPDAERFRQYLKKLRQETWLGARSWWPKYLFHHTDITKVVSILKLGFLLSRSQIDQLELDFIDSASRDVIENTDEWVNDYVRFYFRPNTPTLFHSEGFRPIGRRSLNAHCPVPVYLLFDFEEIICRTDSYFSKGTLAGHNREIFFTFADFERLPFQSIYQEGPHDRGNRMLVFHKQAEIIIPTQLELNGLKLIWCRSQAEYETLRYLLQQEALWNKWKDKITARKEDYLFKRKWLYVEEVNLTRSEIRLRFHYPDSMLDAGPFKSHLEVKEVVTGIPYILDNPQYTVPPNSYDSFSLRNLRYPEHYVVRFFLDSHPVYVNEYEEASDVPF